VNTNLRDAIQARDAAAEITELAGKIIKLEAAVSKSSPAADELATLRQAAAAAALEWDGESDLPRVDHKREAQLRDEIESFESSKRSAQEAIKVLADRKGAAHRAHAEANKRAELAAMAQLLTEEGPKLDAAVRETAQAYVNANELRTRFRGFILEQANRHGDSELNLRVEHSNILFETPVGVADLTDLNARLAQLLTASEA
jgi:hypothetical protein